MTDAWPFKPLKPQAKMNPAADTYGRVAIALSRLAAMQTPCKLDVAYGPEPAQRLDIYMPEQGAKGPFPVFVCFHGGGLMFGYKEWMGLNAPVITRFPAILVSADHLLIENTPAAYEKTPLQLADTAAAVAWTFRNIAQFGGDPNRIHIGGHSAGGILSGLLAVRPDVLEKAGLPADVIKSCFPVSGVYDWRDTSIYGYEQPREGISAGPKQHREAMSAITHVGKTHTPYFISWGENDNDRTGPSSAAMLAALRAAGVRAEGLRFPMLDHFWAHVDQQREANPWTRTLRNWMLGDPQTAPVGRA